MISIALTIENVDARISIKTSFESKIGIDTFSPLRKLPSNEFALTISSIGKPKFKESEIIRRFVLSIIALAPEVKPVTLRLYNSAGSN